MTDFHTHILPGMDDGAATTAEALHILRALCRAGFTDVVLTPHYYSNREPLEAFVRRREECTAALCTAALCTPTHGEELPWLYTGAEVYLTSLLFNNGDLTPLTVGGNGRFMLVELPWDEKLSAATLADLEHLVYCVGITPVLAHIERYPHIIRGKSLPALLEIGCRLQTNLQAFTVPTYRRKLKRLAKNEQIDALGTDVHRAAGFEDELKKALAAVRDSLGEGFLKGISGYTKERIINA